MPQKKLNYKCSQQELYAVCKLAWDGCDQHLAKFQNFSPKYNPEFINARKEEISMVVAIPDSASRSSVVESARIQLKEQSRTCLETWQKLKRYIAEAYPKSLQEVKLKAAGKGYYRDAKAFNWEACQGIMSSGGQFIAAESEALLMNDIMPPAFPDEFNSLRATFENLYLRYLAGTKQAGHKTDEKVSANNHLFDVMMSMLLDGQEIFRHDKAMQKEFVFDQILQNVSGHGVAGFKGLVTNSAKEGEPIEGATLTLNGNGHICVTDDEGWYQFTQLHAGHYSIEIEAPGFQTLKIDKIEIKTGIMSNLHVQLLPEL
jgi:hypothetical protein